jgi:hypothetical protein
MTHAELEKNIKDMRKDISEVLTLLRAIVKEETIKNADTHN